MSSLIKWPFVSIVVPTFNGGDIIAKCLDSVLSLDYPQDRFEVIVVDDCSTDTTSEILIRYEEKGVKIIRHEVNRGPAVARNTGIKVAKGEIIAFIDDDAEALPDWLHNLIKYYTHNKVGGVGGNSFGYGEKHNMIVKYNYARAKSSPLSKYAQFGTGNVSYRRDVILKAGGFDESLRVGEDLDLMLKVTRLGYEFLEAPNAMVRLKTFDKFTGLIKWGISRGRGRIIFVRKYKLKTLGIFGVKEFLLKCLLSVMTGIFVFLLSSFLFICLCLMETILYYLYRGLKLAKMEGHLRYFPFFAFYDFCLAISMILGLLLGFVALLRLTFMWNKNMMSVLDKRMRETKSI